MKFTILHINGIPGYITNSWFAMAVIIAVSYLATRHLSIIPGSLQNFIEYVLESIENLLLSFSSNGPRFLPLLGTLGIFILLSNLIGLVPGFISPTSSLNTTVALALVVFFSTHFVGFKELGVSYLKQFTGNNIFLAPILLPIHIVSEIARPLSLSVRLFGNIMGEDKTLAMLYFLVSLIVIAMKKVLLLKVYPVFIVGFVIVFLIRRFGKLSPKYKGLTKLLLVTLGVFSLAPLGAPLPVMFLAIFTSIIQTFIFVLLATLYICGAMEELPERK